MPCHVCLGVCVNCTPPQTVAIVFFSSAYVARVPRAAQSQRAPCIRPSPPTSRDTVPLPPVSLCLLCKQWSFVLSFFFFLPSPPSVSSPLPVLCHQSLHVSTPSCCLFPPFLSTAPSAQPSPALLAAVALLWPPSQFSTRQNASPAPFTHPVGVPVISVKRARRVARFVGQVRLESKSDWAPAPAAAFP